MRLRQKNPPRLIQAGKRLRQHQPPLHGTAHTPAGDALEVALGQKSWKLLQTRAAPKTSHPTAQPTPKLPPAPTFPRRRGTRGPVSPTPMSQGPPGLPELAQQGRCPPSTQNAPGVSHLREEQGLTPKPNPKPLRDVRREKAPGGQIASGSVKRQREN